jgi:hypothetical protein
VGQRSHESLADHVFGHADERDGPGDGLKRTQGWRRPGDDRIGRGTDQGRCAIGEIIVGRLEAARNDNQVFSLDEAVEPQLVEQCLDHRCLPGSGQQESETIGAARLLRARRARPGGGGTEQRDEFAALHVVTLPWQLHQQLLRNANDVVSTVFCAG